MAAGAISYYLDHFVVGRIIRYTYGTPASTMFDPSDPEHRRRADKMFLGITGQLQLDVFSPTLFKVGNRLSPSDRILATKTICRAREHRVRRSFARRLLGLARSLRLPERTWNSR